MSSPSPGLLTLPVLLKPASDGGERTAGDVGAVSGSSEKSSVSFGSPTLTVEAGTTPGAPLGDVVETGTLFVQLTEGLRGPAELSSSSVLPETKMKKKQNRLQDYWGG